MNTKLRFLGGLVVPMVLVIACGSSDKSKGGGTGGADAGPSAGGSSSGGTSGGTGGGTHTGGTSSVLDSGKDKCDMSSCTGNSKGAACCVTSAVCGITVLGICLPLSVVNQFPSGDAGFGKAEKVVPDPKCKGVTFNGYTLTGCCDISGVCGVSTGGIPANPLISVPLQCVTPAESSKFGGIGAGAGVSTDAGPEVPCDYPGSDAGSKSDAGN